jgi:hypothetical protein
MNGFNLTKLHNTFYFVVFYQLYFLFKFLFTYLAFEFLPAKKLKFRVFYYRSIDNKTSQRNTSIFNPPNIFFPLLHQLRLQVKVADNMRGINRLVFRVHFTNIAAEIYDLDVKCGG